MTLILNHLRDSARGHANARALFGRFKASRMGVLDTTGQRYAALWAEGLTDLSTPGRGTVPYAVLTQGAGGIWQVHEMQAADWNGAGFVNSPFVRAMRSADGATWLPFGLWFDSNLALARVGWPGLDLQYPAKISSDGSVAYTSNVIYDPSHGTERPKNEQRIHGAWMASAPHAHTGWAVDDQELPHRLIRLNGPGEPQRIAGGPPGAAIDGIYPFGEGAMIWPSFLRGAVGSSELFWLWDGSNWTHAPDEEALFAAQANAVAALSMPIFPQFTRNTTAMIAGDGKDHVWFLHARTEIDDRGFDKHLYSLRFFDGKTRQDVWRSTGMGPENIEIMGTINDAAELLVFDRGTAELVRIFQEGARLKTERLIKVPPKGEYTIAMRPYPGMKKIWIMGTTKSYVYESGAIKALDRELEPLGMDSKDRFWSYEDNLLTVDFADKTVHFPPSAVRARRILEDKDGGLLALDSAGVTRIILGTAATPPKASFGARFEWEVPKNDCGMSFIDESNLIWFSGNGRAITRVTLPASFWANTP